MAKGGGADNVAVAEGRSSVMSVARFGPLFAIAVIACSSLPTDVPCGSGAAGGIVGVWAIRVQNVLDGDDIHMLEVVPRRCGSVRGVFVQSNTWRGDAVTDLTGLAGDGTADDSAWTIAFDDTLALKLFPTSDSLFGIIVRGDSAAADTAPLFGFRVDSAVLGVHRRNTPRISCETPIVHLRLDDVPLSDRPFIEALLRRGLTAEVAVATTYPGQVDRIGWLELRDWASHGISIAGHSRHHSDTTDKNFGFLSEVVGSLDDLARHGLATDLFVQPGPWRGGPGDSIYFDDPGKFENWRGSVLRTLTSAFEAYVGQGDAPCPVPPPDWIGLGHYTISGASTEEVLTWWAMAQTPGRVTSFLVHTSGLPRRGALDWFLDSLAAAKSDGRVRVIGSPVPAF